MHIHDISKSADAETELLPDITGTIIIYAGAPKAQVDVTYRDTHEATITAGMTSSSAAAPPTAGIQAGSGPPMYF